MSNGFSDKIKGTGNKLKGEVKESVGRNTNDPSLQAEGKRDQVKGKAQEKIGDAKESISNRMDNRK
ncbi:CsbD family protein [Solibacillus sp. FSL W8-0474]|uniref:CsbD family protein n=1 Tax=Solibacillus sp. FSL W8-0474 TaxID=2975336 RepID=UPI0030F5B0A3